MGALVGAAYAGAWVTVSERDEQPHERLVLRIAGQLKHKRERSLRWRLVGDWQLQLGAAGELGAVGSERLAGEQRGERHVIALYLRACAGRDLKRSAGEAADRLAPDVLVKADGEALTLRHSQPSPSRGPI